MLNIIGRYKNLRHFFESVWWVIKSGYPARKLIVIGVTGTDGKTTTSHLIYEILKSSEHKVALISTLGAFVGDKKIDTGFHVTTPDAKFLQPFIKEIVSRGVKYLVLETTSHGLDQHRTLGCNFSIGVLTNITHEHLDYHKTFKNYLSAKAKLFNSSKIAILNKSDSSYPKINKLIKKSVKHILYDEKTLKGKFRNAANFRFNEPFNLLNATAAILVAKSFGISDNDIEKSIKTFPSVEGRMEEIKNNRGIRVIVDFAHTPNALENVLNVLKKQVSKGKKLIAVFGCAGERDVEKRPMMAKISTQLADISIFTAEDPRNEDVNEIIEQMKKGIKNKKAKVYEIPDRLNAIKYAISIAKKGDTVAICGKGHEKSMNFNGVEYPWLDKEAVKSALGKRISAIVLAAGKGSRMGGKIPKVLLSINGKSILHKGLKKIKEMGVDDVVVVTGFGSTLVADEVKKIGYKVKIVRQGRKTGTAGATISGLKKVSKKSDTVLVVYGDDSALYNKNTLYRFIKYYYSQNRHFSVAVIEVKGVSPLGGLEVDSNRDIVGVLTPDQIVSRGDKTTLVLCGLLCFERTWLIEKIKLIPKNPKSGEYSLPYLFRIAYQEGNAAKPFLIKNDLEWNSVNTQEDLKIARKKGENKWKK